VPLIENAAAAANPPPRKPRLTISWNVGSAARLQSPRVSSLLPIVVSFAWILQRIYARKSLSLVQTRGEVMVTAMSCRKRGAERRVSVQVEKTRRKLHAQFVSREFLRLVASRLPGGEMRAPGPLLRAVGFDIPP
jgi:hypothetical protein